MSFMSEWALAVHRAVWFPLYWLVGLEREGILVLPMASVSQRSQSRYGESGLKGRQGKAPLSRPTK